MPPFAKALFNAANGTIITAYTPEIGTLATHPVSASGVSVIRDGRLRASASLTDEIYFFSETPPDPNYPVISRQRYYSGVGLFRLYTRLSPLSLTAYVVEWYNGGYRLSRFRYPPDTTILTGVTYPLTSGTTNSVAIQAVNTDDGNVRVSVFVNGVRIINYLDDSADKITDTGHAGFQFYDTDAGDAAGFHLDSIQAGLGDDDVIGVTDTALYVSPFNWYSDGTGARQSNNVRGGSTFIESGNPGAYAKVGFQGTRFGAVIPTSHLAGAESGWPWIKYIVDADPTTAGQSQFGWLALHSGTDTFTLALDLEDGDHTIWFGFAGTTISNARWADPLANSVKITGFVLDDGKVLLPASGDIAVKSHTMFSGNDSIGEGYAVLSGGDGPANQDAFRAWPWLVAAAMDAELGVAAYGSQGYSSEGIGGVPAFHDPENTAAASWKFYSGGRSRLNSGKMWPRPTYVFECLGTNSGDTGQESVESFLSEMRAATGTSTVVFSVIPLGGWVREDKEAGFAEYQLATPDLRTGQLDCGEEFQEGLDGEFGVPTDKSVDGIHPNVATHIEAAGIISGQALAFIAELPPVEAVVVGYTGGRLGPFHTSPFLY